MKEKKKKNNFDFKIYTSQYFNTTSQILKDTNDKVVLQFTNLSNKSIVACGIEYIVKLIQELNIDYKFSNLQIFGYKDGTIINHNKPILFIVGNYWQFSFLENIIDGILTRMCSVATNTREIIDLIGKRKIDIFGMFDRQDLYINQPYDGYAAYIGGIRKFSTVASTVLLNNKSDIVVYGTMPHALIACKNGSLGKAIDSFSQTFPNKNIIVLVDYDNDIVKAINIISNSKKNIYAIRIDTAPNIIDKSLPKNKINYGINLNLIKLARKQLDKRNLKHVKIIISSGLTYLKIKEFIAKNAPIDGIGIGGFLLKINCKVSGDIVLVNKKPQSKYGRKFAFKKYADMTKLPLKFKIN